MQFVYEAVGKSGRVISGRETADTPEALQAKLLVTGLALISLRRDYLAFLRPNDKPRLLKRRRLIELFGYLHDLTDMGVSMSLVWNWVGDALTDKGMQDAIVSIRQSMEQGFPLAEAMRRTQVFPAMVIGQVQAGEVSGNLEKTYASLEQHYREEQELVDQIMKATMYPAISITVLFAIFAGLLAYVLPQLEPIFPKKLPLPTLILVTLSHGVRYWWWATPLVIAAIPFSWKRLPMEFKTRLWEFMYGVWLVGPLLKGLALSTFFRNFAMMLNAGIPILQAFDIVVPLSATALLTEKLRAAQAMIAQGSMVSEGFKDPFFPKVVASAMLQGETTGHLDIYMDKTSRFLRSRARAQLQTMSTFLEPALLLVGGGMIMLLGIGIFLPIYSQMQHGGVVGH